MPETVVSAEGESGRGLDADERAELERLRVEIAEIRSGQPSDVGKESTRRRINWRMIGVVALVILCAVLTLLSVTTRYVRSQILDTDHYVSTVAPLASNPAVQQQVTNSITNEINQQTNIEEVTSNALNELTQLTPADRPRVDQAITGLAPVISAQAESFIHNTVAQFVGSDQFAALWTTANREAHDAVVAAVTGDTQHGAVNVDTTNGSISIELGPIITQVKQRLSAQGFAFADKIPVVNKQFVVWQSKELARAQNLVRSLDKVATVLPWLAILVALAAIGLAGVGRRIRTLTAIGIAVVGAMLVLAIGIIVGRTIYLNNVPADVLSPAAAQAIFDTVISPLRTALRAVAVLGLVLAVVGFFAGGTRAAGATRRAIAGGFETVDRRRKQRSASMVEAQLWRLRYVVRLGVPIIAAFVLMFWHYPTGMVVFWVAVVACLILAAFEFAIAPARRGVAAGSVVAEDIVAESAGPESSEIVVTDTVVTETVGDDAAATVVDSTDSPRAK